MNFGARLVGAAKGGELIMSEPVWQDVSGDIFGRAAQPGAQGIHGASEGVRCAGLKTSSSDRDYVGSWPILLQKSFEAAAEQ